MERDIGTKLRLTSTVLGCKSHKELCARFRDANPTTHFDLERSQKWVQGRALPRSAEVYNDWAKVLGTKRPGTWLAGASIDAFVAEMATLFSLGPDTLATALPTLVKASAPAVKQSPNSYLCGAYAVYSPAWSPYYRGRLVRASLRISLGRGGTLPVTYLETLMGRSVHFHGDTMIGSRSLHLSVRENDGGYPIFFSFYLPGPPATALTGVMSGCTIVGHDPRPTTTRAVAIRVAEDAPLDASNRYLERGESIAADLAALGLTGAALDEVEATVRGLLEDRNGVARLEQVSSAEQNRLMDALYPASVHDLQR
jgi:hypothetical protein